MNIKLVVLAVVLLVSSGKCRAKNILCIMGIGTESTDKWNKVLLKELTKKGHDLTIVTAYSPWNDVDDDIQWSNAEFIYLEKTQHYLKQRYENVTSHELLERCIWKYIIHWYDRQMATCRGNFESVGFSEVLHLAVKEKRQYDAIIYDMTYGPGCLLHLAYLWKNAPIIGITSGNLNADILSMSRDTMLKPSLDPYMLSDFTTNMNYWKRLQNTALYAFDYCYRQWVVKPVIEGIWSKNMHSNNIYTPTSLNGLTPRFRVILTNYHPSLHSLQILPVNVIPVPGLHIQQDSQEPMANEYLQFIRETKLEVILIDVDMKTIGSNTTQQILEVLQALPDNGFIWLKGDTKLMGKNKPTNLLLVNDGELVKILDHEKVQCSVLTADSLSIQESIFYRVPFIAIQTRPEERYTAKRIAEGNFGIPMDLPTFTGPLFQTNLKRCLSDKSLRNSLRQIQNSLRNQQNPALQTASWWVEHIVENPQTNDHLLSNHKESLSYITENSLDVIAIFQLFLVLCIINTIIVFRQTLQSFKKVSKANKEKTKSESGKKTKKSKAKTS